LKFSHRYKWDIPSNQVRERYEETEKLASHHETKFSRHTGEKWSGKFTEYDIGYRVDERVFFEAPPPVPFW
jgi:hypothetical protein